MYSFNNLGNLKFSSLTEKSKYYSHHTFAKKLQTIYKNAKTSSSPTLTHASFEFHKSLQYYNKYVMNKNVNVYFTAQRFFKKPYVLVL